MEEFYETLEWYIKDRNCPDCNEQLWQGYADGHMWDKCLKCGYPNDSLDPAGYIIDQPIPEGALPDHFESAEIQPNINLKPHERYYRRKLNG